MKDTLKSMGTIAATLIAFGSFAGSASAVVITYNSSSLTESGFSTTIVSGSALFFDDADNVHIPNSGSVALLVNNGSPASMTISAISGDTFDLLSFRASEGRNISTGFFPDFGSTGITVEGTLSGGGTVSNSFLYDQVAEENSALDFQTFSPIGFSNLTSVSFTATGGNSAYSFGIDDVNVIAVPEPSSALLLGLGSLGLAALRRRGTAKSNKAVDSTRYRA